MIFRIVLYFLIILAVAVEFLHSVDPHSESESDNVRERILSARLQELLLNQKIIKEEFKDYSKTVVKVMSGRGKDSFSFIDNNTIKIHANLLEEQWPFRFTTCIIKKIDEKESDGFICFVDDDVYALDAVALSKGYKRPKSRLQIGKISKYSTKDRPRFVGYKVLIHTLKLIFESQI